MLLHVIAVIGALALLLFVFVVIDTAVNTWANKVLLSVVVKNRLNSQNKCCCDMIVLCGLNGEGE